tara:strand:- start:1035 stop:2156 length:1122 start_codon:yes stop_codon:yes gene_type:complete
MRPLADSAEIDKLLSKAKVHLMSKPDATFFTVVCLSLVHKWSEDVPTAATNGTTVLYNADFFSSLSPEERVGLILHETLHVVFQHMLRLGDKDPRKWNRAADYAINLIIVIAGFKLPEGALLDFKYQNMSAEHIYTLLPDDPEESKFDSDIQYTDEIEQLSVQSQIDEILVQASTQSAASGDSYGSIPASIQRYVDNLVNPQVPWHRILSAYFSQLKKSEYSYRKPNRRYLPTHILPTLVGESLCNGAVAVDASGSVNDSMFSQFVNETSGIIRKQRPDELHFLQFTSELVGEPEKITSLSDLKNLKFAGRGGTAIDPVMEWAKENKPNWLVVFTDGHYKQPEINPKVPVIWVIYEYPEFTAPFGKTIHYTLN